MADDVQVKIQDKYPNVQELVKKARGIYDGLRAEMEPSRNGQYIVIEADSGKHFLGATKDEAMAEARKEFPGILLFVRRIGELEKNSYHSSSLSSKKYASIL